MQKPNRTMLIRIGSIPPKYLDQIWIKPKADIFLVVLHCFLLLFDFLYIYLGNLHGQM